MHKKITLIDTFERNNYFLLLVTHLISENVSNSTNDIFCEE